MAKIEFRKGDTVVIKGKVVEVYSNNSLLIAMPNGWSTTRVASEHVLKVSDGPRPMPEPAEVGTVVRTVGHHAATHRYFERIDQRATMVQNAADECRWLEIGGGGSRFAWHSILELGAVTVMRPDE